VLFESVRVAFFEVVDIDRYVHGDRY